MSAKDLLIWRKKPEGKICSGYILITEKVSNIILIFLFVPWQSNRLIMPLLWVLWMIILSGSGLPCPRGFPVTLGDFLFLPWVKGLTYFINHICLKCLYWNILISANDKTVLMLSFVITTK